MANTANEHKVTNCLDNYINREVGRRMANNGGIKVLKQDIMEEIANFSGCGYDNINRVKRKLVVPSLPVALRIAEYFNEKVENIFKIV